MATKGYTKRPRYIEDLELMGKDEPFDKVHAYDYLLSKANIEKKTFPLRGSKCLQTVDRGQLFTSIDALAKAWRWSKNKVRGYLCMLEGIGLAHTEGTTNGTLLTLLKYDDEGTSPHTVGTTIGTTDGTTDGTTVGTRLKKRKNNSKEPKKKGATPSLKSFWENPE